MKKFLFVLCVVLSLALSACGGGGAASTTMEVTMSDFMFEPMDFTVAADQEITLTITNNGAVEHEFVIMAAGQHATAPFSEDDEPNIYWEVEVEPGKTETITFTAPPAGEYEVVCGIAGHYEAGMIGSLTSK